MIDIGLTCRTPNCPHIGGPITGHCEKHADQIRRAKRLVGSNGKKALTSEQIFEIRKRTSRFESTTKIAQEMNLSQTTVLKYQKKS